MDYFVRLLKESRDASKEPNAMASMVEASKSKVVAKAVEAKLQDALTEWKKDQIVESQSQVS